MNKKIKYFPYFLITIGLSNLLLGTAVILLRYLEGRAGDIYGSYLKNVLFVLDPYVKVLWEILVVIYFARKIHEDKYHNDRLLIVTWGFIFTEVQILHYISSTYYNMVIIYMQPLSDNAAYAQFYNGTHVFKYKPMFIAFLIGIFITGIILTDKKFLILSIVLGIMYGLCYGPVFMQKISLPFFGNVGIVMSSVIFHLTESLLMLLIGLNIRRRYTGVS